MRYFFAALVVASSVTGCSHFQRGFMAMSGSPFPPDPESRLRGRVVYRENCTGCHGISGEGNGPDLDLSAAQPPDLTGEQYTKSLGLTAANITYGKRRDMPAFKEKLSERDIWDVARYVLTLRQ